MPNTFAYLVSFSWPLVVLWLLLRYPVYKALFFAISLSLLLLPANFQLDAPLIPPLNKESITSLSIVLFLFLMKKKFKFFQSGVISKIIIGYLIVIVISSELNGSIEIIGSKFLPGLTHYDAFSNVVRTLIFLIPFFLGRYFFTSLKNNEYIFKALVVMSLIYSIPIIYELRFSPQLHYDVYGYHASDFIQSLREGSYRASVFIGHGLALTFWLSTCAIAAMALHKNKIRIGKLSTLMIILFLLAIIALSKTWSAYIYVAIGIAFVYFLSPKNQIKLAFILAALIMLYPSSKIMGVFPDKAIIRNLAEYNVERAKSMTTRYVNEEVLLEHALKKPFFGWGGWGRNRIYDNTGKDNSITDGRWIIEYGNFGAFGFIFYYLILLTPLYYALKNVGYIDDPNDRVYFSVLAIFLALCIIDSVPNNSMGSLNLLLAGALLGQAEFLKKQRSILVNQKQYPNHR